MAGVRFTPAGAGKPRRINLFTGPQLTSVAITTVHHAFGAFVAFRERVAVLRGLSPEFFVAVTVGATAGLAAATGVRVIEAIVTTTAVRRVKAYIRVGVLRSRRIASVAWGARVARFWFLRLRVLWIGRTIRRGWGIKRRRVGRQGPARIAWSDGDKIGRYAGPIDADMVVWAWARNGSVWGANTIDAASIRGALIATLFTPYWSRSGRHGATRATRSSAIRDAETGSADHTRRAVRIELTDRNVREIRVARIKSRYALHDIRFLVDPTNYVITTTTVGAG